MKLSGLWNADHIEEKEIEIRKSNPANYGLNDDIMRKYDVKYSLYCKMLCNII